MLLFLFIAERKYLKINRLKKWDECGSLRNWYSHYEVDIVVEFITHSFLFSHLHLIRAYPVRSMFTWNQTNALLIILSAIDIYYFWDFYAKNLLHEWFSTYYGRWVKHVITSDFSVIWKSNTYTVGRNIWNIRHEI